MRHAPGNQGDSPRLNVGSEHPMDPEDLTMADGEDPTPENVERHRRLLEEKGRRAIDESAP
ncbi:hypothetical protein D5H75_39040 [Bailinhaonella thermotolerans]|uniref:Uncharacterized protein n=1 Tax=Bailinhaonella thermotolerans TaxID=1070861 RepID=A0A3A4A0T7_9ACTN|nr:hypothetical protein D5H75_39040 [Bailinhaonella thermotolerans]